MKLWFFRTPDKRYGLATCELDFWEMNNCDSVLSAGYRPQKEVFYVARRNPRDFPELQPGECVPVELVPAKKKARKG